jgi:hypothetical protein
MDVTAPAPAKDKFSPPSSLGKRHPTPHAVPSSSTAAAALSGSPPLTARRYSYRTWLLSMGTALYLPLWVHSHYKSYLHWTEGRPPSQSVHSLSNPALEFFKAGMDGTGSNGRTRREVELLRDRLSYLEAKVNSYLAFASDPFLSQRAPAQKGCRHLRESSELACPDKDAPCELDSHVLCLDDFPAVAGPPGGASGEADGATAASPPCLVYDFGIRRSPEFGLAFAGPPFGCEVVGFDPSPISLQWWEEEGKAITEKYPSYKFLPTGAAGHDGETRLLEYDWGQVSIIEFPNRVVDTTNCTPTGQCRYRFHEPQRAFSIPVKTLPTFVRDLGHDGRRITLLKLDVEGSEYALLEHLIEHDLALCRRIDQITLEWHHYDFDRRYGVTSNPQINVLVHLLEVRCGLEQFWYYPGWPSNIKQYSEMGMTLYYSLSSFRRTRWWDGDGKETDRP